jgi:hypothetical protein
MWYTWIVYVVYRYYGKIYPSGKVKTLCVKKQRSGKTTGTKIINILFYNYKFIRYKKTYKLYHHLEDLYP